MCVIAFHCFFRLFLQLILAMGSTSKFLIFPTAERTINLDVLMPNFRALSDISAYSSFDIYSITFRDSIRMLIYRKYINIAISKR